MKTLRISRKMKAHNRRQVKRARVIGYVLHETADIVIIATLKTANRKTGKMIQIWIINRNVSPMDAMQSGATRAICFDCPHMGDGTGKARTCYVNLRYVQAIWKAYQRGRYEFLPMSEYARVFTGKAVRFGAYGEPVLLPMSNFQAIAAVASKWTGYTHQWRKAEFAAYRAFLMASCDSERDAQDATAAGWRYFRVRSQFAPMRAGEIMCPASPEGGNKSQCARCGLCNGSKAGDVRKSIVIIVHGSGSKNFVSLESLTMKAAA